VVVVNAVFMVMGWLVVVVEVDECCLCLRMLVVGVV